MNQLDNILQKYLSPKQMWGIDCQIVDKGVYLFRGTLLKEQKGKVHIVKQVEADTLEALKTELGSDEALVLTITGKGLIIRALTGITEKDDDDSILEEALPNSKPSDFILDTHRLEDGNCMAYIARRDMVDQVLEQFSHAGLYVIQTFLGAAAVSPVLSFIEEDKLEQDILSIGCYDLHLSDKQVDEVKLTSYSSDDSYNIAGSWLPAAAMLAFAGGISYFLGVVEREDNNILNEAIHRRVFKIGVKVVLVSCLAMLLINFLLFQQLYGTNGELSAEYALNQKGIVQLQDLREQHTKNQSYLSEEGWLSVSKSSFYADRIAASLPENIQLAELSIFPVIEEEGLSKPNQRLQFKNNHIVVHGTVGESITLNEWVAGMKTLEWVEGIEIIAYTQDKPNSPGVFEVLISIG